jgi:HlyD family secretion protein
LTQAYTQGKQGIKQVLAAQQSAAQEGFAAKQEALEEAYAAKRGAVVQLGRSMSAMQKSAQEQQNQIKQQLASFQTGLSGLSSAPQSGMASMMAASQSSAIQFQLDAARTRLLAVDSEIAKVKGGQLEIDAKSKMLKVNSPIAGRCVTSSVHLGETPIPGQSVITLINPSSTRLRAFIPENLIGGIKVGQRAQVHLDLKQAPAIEATVSAIDEQASFTPENISLPEDRVHQVFGVKLTLKDPNGYAKPGMPADATINLE